MKLNRNVAWLLIPIGIATACGGGQTTSFTSTTPAASGASAQAPAQPGTAPATSPAATTPTQQAAPAPATAPAATTPAALPTQSSSAATTPARTAQLATTAPASEPARPAPEYREVTIPEGTTLSLVLETAVASDSSKVEDRVRAHTRQAVVVGGTRAIPQGAVVVGTVTDAKESGRVKGLARVSFRFNNVRVNADSYNIRTSLVTREAQSTKKEDAKKVGIGAAGGAIVGGILGGKKGLGIGTAVGAGAGTGVVLATKGEEVRLEPGTIVTAKLADPLVVRVKVEKN